MSAYLYINMSKTGNNLEDHGYVSLCAQKYVQNQYILHSEHWLFVKNPAWVTETMFTIYKFRNNRYYAGDPQIFKE